MGKRYTVAVDFDGVIHSYTTPWINAHTIPDPPIEGSIEWLWETIQRMDVAIFSTRAKTWRGRRAIRRYIAKHGGALYFDDGLGGLGLERITITATKIPALIYLDDRAWRFEGTYPTADQIHRAHPWKASVPAPPLSGEPSL